MTEYLFPFPDLAGIVKDCREKNENEVGLTRRSRKGGRK